MLFKAFSRVLVLVSLCALFAAVASKPARLSRESLQKRIANHAVSGTKTLKQYDVRALRTHERRQGPSIIAADRTDPTEDSNRGQTAAAPTPAAPDSNADQTAVAAPTSAANNIINFDAAQGATNTEVSLGLSLPTGLSGRQEVTNAVLPTITPVTLPVSNGMIPTNTIFADQPSGIVNTLTKLRGTTEIKQDVNQSGALLL